MKSLFISVLNMSITGSVVILAVVLGRFILKKAPKKYSYILWLIPAFRLICPFSFRSALSIFNFSFFNVTSRKNTYIPTMNFVSESLEPTVRETENIVYAGGFASGTYEVESVYSSEEIIMLFLAGVWLVGALALFVYGIISYRNIKTCIGASDYYKENIYINKYISSPFVLGFIKPEIYLPYSLDEADYAYVLAHEGIHINRKDHIIKLAAYFILCVHWFNPLCYLAFFLMSKDMEMSCDERVLRENEGIKKNYSITLLSFASGKKFSLTSPLAFGETSVKSRIKNVLGYKKPVFAASAAGVLLLAVIIVLFMSNPSVKKLKEIAPMVSTEKYTDYEWVVGTNYNTHALWYGQWESFVDELEEIEIYSEPLKIAENKKDDDNFVLAVSINGEIYEKNYIFINFSKDYTEVWVNDVHLNDKTENSDVYKVKNPQRVKEIIESTRDTYYQNYLNILYLENDFTVEKADNKIIEIFIDKNQLPQLSEIPSDRDEGPTVMYEFENDGILVYDGDNSDIYLKYILRTDNGGKNMLRFDFRTVYDIKNCDNILIYGDYQYYYGLYESKPFGDYLEAFDNIVYDGGSEIENGIENVGNIGPTDLMGIGRSAHIEVYMDEEVYSNINDYIKFYIDSPSYNLKAK